MLNKKLIVGISAFVLLFLGIYSFALPNNDDKDKKPNVVENEDKDEEQNPEFIDNEEDDEVAGPQVVEEVDNVDPVLTLNGGAELFLEIGGTYTELNATAHDNVDGDIPVVITGTVNNRVAGVYVLTYTATDESDNSASLTRTVKVRPNIVCSVADPYEMGEEFNVPTCNVVTDLDGKPESLPASNAGDVIRTVAGNYQLNYSFETPDGVLALEQEVIFTVEDTTPPTIEFVTNGDTTYSKMHSTVVNITDNGNIDPATTKYKWTTSDTLEPTEEQFEGGNFTSGDTITTSTGLNGTYYLWILAKDEKGNKAINHSDAFNLDNTAPVFTGLVNTSHTTGNITINVTESNLKEIKVINQDLGTTTVVPNGTVLTAEATYHIFAKDEANNQSDIWLAIDRTNPTIEGVTDGAYYKEPVNIKVADKFLTTVTLNNVSKSITVVGPNNENKKSEFQVSEDGVYTVVGIDKVGNRVEVTFTVDKTAPTKPVLNLNGYVGGSWTNQDINIGFTSTDNGSGIDHYEWATGPNYADKDWRLTTNPYHVGWTLSTTVYIRAVDKAGNKSVASDATAIRSDRYKPLVILPTNTNTNYVKALNVEVEINDIPTSGNKVSSGMNTLKYLWVSSTDTTTVTESSFTKDFTLDANNKAVISNTTNTGTYYLYILVKDNASNVTIKKSDLYYIDNNYPSVSFVTNGNGAYAKKHSTVVNISDVSSLTANRIRYAWTTGDRPTWSEWFTLGTQFSSGDTIETPEGLTGVYYLWIMTEDTLLNRGYTRSNAFNLDNKAPEFTVSGNPTYYVNTDVTLTVNATDNISSTLLYSFNNGEFSSNNTKTFTENGDVLVKVKDEVGNVSEQTIVIDKIDRDVIKITKVLSNGSTTPIIDVKPRITVSAREGLLPSTGIRYVWTTSAERPSDNLFTNTANPNYDAPNNLYVNYLQEIKDSITNPTGIYYLWIKLEDKVGNTLYFRTNSFKMDNDTPTTPTVDFNGYTPGVWDNETLNIDLHSIDNGSNVTYQYKFSDFYFWYTVTGSRLTLADGSFAGLNRNISFRAIDEVGHISGETEYYNVRIEKFKPYVIYTADNGRTTYKTNHTVNTYIVDGNGQSGLSLSDVKYVWSKSAIGFDSESDFAEGLPVTINSNYANISGNNTMDGTYYLWVIAKDIAGNITIGRSEAYYFDNNAPTIRIDGEPYIEIELGSNFDILSDIVASDGPNPYNVTHTTVDLTTIGLKEVTYTVTDRIGRTASVTRQIKVIDTTDPIINLSAINYQASYYNVLGHQIFKKANANFNVSVTDLGGFKELKYLWLPFDIEPDNVAWFIAPTFTNNTNISKDFYASGIKWKLWIFAKDKSNNVTITSTDEFEIK